MLKNLSIQRQIFGIVLIISLFLLMVGVAAYYYMGKIGKEFEEISTEVAPDVQFASVVSQNILQRNQTIQAYLKAGEPEFVERFQVLESEMRELIATQQSVNRVGLEGVLDSLQQRNQRYANTFNNKLIPITKEQAAILKTVVNDISPIIQKNLNNIMRLSERDEDLALVRVVNRAVQHFLGANIFVREYMIGNRSQDLERVNLELMAFEDNLFYMQEAIEMMSDARYQEWYTTLLQDFVKFQESFNGLVKAISTRNELTEELVEEHSKNIEQVTLDFQNSKWDELLLKNQKVTDFIGQTNRIVVIIVILAVAIGMFFSLVMTRRIGSLLKESINHLSDGSKNVENAAQQLTFSTEKLTESATEQAATLEEISASLEEMSSMTSRNTENTLNVKDQAEQSTEKMHHLSESMDQIKQSSDRISGITKIIDDIAFQTNILSLNAAVEAARAGDAGLGFAVVADEVRNLALQSAEAAKDIAEKVQDNQRKFAAGMEVTRTVIEAFTSITRSIHEITIASQEQSQGIRQITIATNELDKVTQQNAAAAESNSLATTHLNGEVTHLQGVVNTLQEIVDGQDGNGNIPMSHPSPDSTQLDTSPAKAPSQPSPPASSTPSAATKLTPSMHPKTPATSQQGMTPNQLIPMHDEKFEDF